MILCREGDQLRLVTGSAVTTDVVVDYLDYVGGPAATPTPGCKSTNITGATTTTVLDHPGGSSGRVVTNVNIANKHASSSNLVTLSLYNSTDATTFQLDKRTLVAGASVTWADGSSGFTATPPANMTQTVQALTIASTLVAADSGKIFTLGTAAGFDTILPAPAAGLFFTFVVKVAPTGSYTITSNGVTQNVIHGFVNTANIQNAGATDSTSGTAVDVITFVLNKSLVGDRVDLICDGTLWYAMAYSVVFDGITFS